MLTLKLHRNLRKQILRGSPWIYRESLESIPKLKPNVAQLCKLKGSSNQFLCWGMYSPQSAIAVRVLKISEKPPTDKEYKSRLQEAFELRRSLRTEANNSYRLINGEGDRLPGMVCDVYGEVAVLQYDGSDCHDFWSPKKWAKNLLELEGLNTVYHKPRHDIKAQPQVWGQALDSTFVSMLENGCHYKVDIAQGQKTGFFLDQRENREFIKSMSQGKKVLNLFSYTGGFSISSAVGGASEVTSVDISSKASELSKENWDLNGLKSTLHKVMTADVFEFLETQNNKFDLVICDPPSMAKSEAQKKIAIGKYTDVFSKAAKVTHSQGLLVLSSCSSHINFEDFMSIVDESLSKARKSGRILKVSGQASDHPWPAAAPELRYLKFVAIALN